MSKMVNAEIVVLIMWICLSSVQIKAFYLMNWTAADMYCEDKGGMLTITDEGKNIFSGLQEHQPYWLTGKIKYSRFVSWRGCYDADNITKHEVTVPNENGLYSCISKCNNSPGKQFSYIGLKSNKCFCLSTDKINTYHYTKDDECGNVDSTRGTNTNSKVNVYEIQETGHLFVNDSKETNLQQCVHANKTQNKVSYGTDSCYKNVSGYICIDGPFQHISNTCKPLNSISSQSYCVRNISTNWIDANQECRRFNGKLVSLIAESSINSIQGIFKQAQSIYWTGIFRDFKIVSSADENPQENVCLSMRIIGENMKLDPDYCSSLKVPLCQRNVVFSHPTKSTFGSTSATGDNKTNSSHYITKTTVAPISAAKPDTKVIIISSVSAAALLLLISCVAYLTIRKSRTVFRGYENRIAANNFYLTPAVNDVNEQASDETALVETATLTAKSDQTVEEAHYELPENNEVTTDDNVYDRTDKISARGREMDIEGKDNIYSHTTKFKSSSGMDDYDVLQLKGVVKSENISNEKYDA